MVSNTQGASARGVLDSSTVKALIAILAVFMALTGLMIAADSSDAAANEARIDTQEYPTFEEAVAAASDGQTVTLLTDVTVTEVTLGKNITIDGADNIFNGKLRIYSEAQVPSFTVTLKNINFRGNGTVNGAIYGQNQNPVANHLCPVNLTLDNCTFQGYTEKCVYLTNVQKLDVRGCEFSFSFANESKYGEYALDLNLVSVTDVQIDIGDSKFTGAVKNSAIKIAQRGADGVTDDTHGDITADVSTSVASVKIHGNTFDITPVPEFRTSNLGDIIIGSSPGSDGAKTFNAAFPVKITSSGSTAVCYRGDKISEAAPFKVTLSSGQTLDASGQIVDGAKKTGKVTLTTDGSITGNVPAHITVPLVAKIGDVSYTSIQAAVAAAEPGSEIILLDDVTVSGLLISKSLTIDGDGHIWNGSVKLDAQGAAEGLYSVILKNILFRGNGTNFDAIHGQNQHDDVRPVDLTLDGCEISGYTNKCVYITNIHSLLVTGCTFSFEFADSAKYGEYAFDLNLVGVTDVIIDIRDSTFTGAVKNSAIKIAQRGDSTTDDIKTDITCNVSTVISSVSIS